jgi:hypothetical protein
LHLRLPLLQKWMRALAKKLPNLNMELGTSSALGPALQVIHKTRFLSEVSLSPPPALEKSESEVPRKNRSNFQSCGDCPVHAVRVLRGEPQEGVDQQHLQQDLVLKTVSKDVLLLCQKFSRCHSFALTSEMIMKL